MDVNLTRVEWPSYWKRDFEHAHENWTNLTLPIESLPEETDSSVEIVQLIQVIARPLIIVLGTIGNLLTFFAMQRGSLRNMSTCFYMAILALADTGWFHLCYTF